MNETKISKGWAGVYLLSIASVIVGDVACLICENYLVEGTGNCYREPERVFESGSLVSICSWLLPSAALIYFFFFKFWRNTTAIDECLSGRIRRWTYFYKTLIWSVLVGLVMTGVSLIVSTNMKMDEAQQWMLGILTQPLSLSITTLIVFPATVRRLHDIGWSCKVAKWQALIAMLTLSGFMLPDLGTFTIIAGFIPNLVLYIIVLFHGGTDGENQYGANPRNK